MRRTSSASVSPSPCLPLHRLLVSGLQGQSTARAPLVRLTPARYPLARPSRASGCEERLLTADRHTRQVKELVRIFALDDGELQHAGRAPAALRALVRRTPHIPQKALHSQSGPQLQEQACLARPLVSKGVRRAWREHAWGSRRQLLLPAGDVETKLARCHLEALFLSQVDVVRARPVARLDEELDLEELAVCLAARPKDRAAHAHRRVGDPPRRIVMLRRGGWREGHEASICRRAATPARRRSTIRRVDTGCDCVSISAESESEVGERACRGRNGAI